MAFYEIPTGPTQRVMTIGLGASAYMLHLAYADAPDGGWFMDLSDAVGNPIVCGVPLVTGSDLLAQFAYLGIGGEMIVTSDTVGTVPTYADLGSTAHLLFADPASDPDVLAYLQGFFVAPGPTSGVIGVMEIGVGRIGALS